MHALDEEYSEASRNQTCDQGSTGAHIEEEEDSDPHGDERDQKSECVGSAKEHSVEY